MDKRFHTKDLGRHTLELDTEDGSLRISGTGRQMFFTREETRDAFLFLSEHHLILQDPISLDSEAERAEKIAAKRADETEEWLTNGRRSENQVYYDESAQEEARLSRSKRGENTRQQTMTESQAQELEQIIRQDAPWLTVSVRPAYWFSDQFDPEALECVVCIEADTFSAEFYHPDEWRRLVEQLDQLDQLDQEGTNSSPYRISQDALSLWAWEQLEWRGMRRPRISDKEIGAAANSYFKSLADGNCPFCQQPTTQKEQRGQCVYALPCGHRLYQGTLQKGSQQKDR